MSTLQEGALPERRSPFSGDRRSGAYLEVSRVIVPADRSTHRGVSYSVEAEREFRSLQAECAAFNAVPRARHAALFAAMRSAAITFCMQPPRIAGAAALAR